MTTPEVHTYHQSPQTVTDVEEAIAVATDSTADTPTTAAVTDTETAAETATEAPAETAAPTATETAFERTRDAAERVGEAVEKVASSIVDRLRTTDAELVEDRGVTTIADEVVEKIAGIAAREVAGVHDLGGEASRVFASLRERVGLAESSSDEADRGVKVKLEGTQATVDITVVIEFGYVVHSVTDAVRTKVISAVENMLGLEVTEVNIRVNDVHIGEGAGEGGEPTA